MRYGGNAQSLRRIRHVKCDEERPACHQCRKTGRLCDGYSTPQKTKSPADIPSLLYGKIFGLSSDAIADFHFAFLKTEEERRYYEYFQCNTRQQINNAFGSSTRVHPLILQGSHANPSIRYTVIALGSLTEHLKGAKALSHNLDENKRHLEYADMHYMRGISRLRKDLADSSDPQPEMILISCLLLSLYDFLRGEEAEGRLHLAAGIDILRRCFAAKLQVVTEAWAIGHHQQQPDLLVEDFAQIFSVMDLHAGIWLSRPCFHSLPMVYPMMANFELGANPSLDDISNILNCQMVRAHGFHHGNAPSFNFQEAPNMPFHVLAEKERLLAELRQWPVLLVQWMSERSILTEDEGDRVALMRMNYHSLFITMSTFFCRPSASLYQSFAKSMSQIISNARLIFDTSTMTVHRDRLLRAVGTNCSEPDHNDMSMFAFVLGAIQPLYTVASKCQDLELCEEAITLLETQPWREGGWDSACMARIARKDRQESI